MIKAWSISRADVFNQCPRRAQLAFIDRIPEPERPPLPDGKEYPNDRGSRIHESAEQYVKGQRNDIIKELKTFKPELERMRALYDQGKVILEEGWGFDRDWIPVDYSNFDAIWLRIIIDALVFINPVEAVVIDYKTGKRVGNEIKHSKQTQAYQLATFIKYPELERVTTELWYTDQNELFSQTFTRDKGMKFYKYYDELGKSVTESTHFPAKPGRNCFFCPYQEGVIGKNGPQGTGDCKLAPMR